MIQTAMELSELLRRFESLQIYIDEDRKLSDGQRILILRTHAPEFPYGQKKHVWATLAISPGQTHIEREEIDSIMRHLVHGSTPLREDELECELLPTDEHEVEISRRIDTLIAEHETGEWNPEKIILEVKKTLNFDPTEFDLDYLEFCAKWRRPNTTQHREVDLKEQE